MRTSAEEQQTQKPMKYLNPKADPTFKKVFGEHPDLVMSLLNALLPLEEGEEITELEYLPAEMVPDNPLRKNSIVDVRCRDNRGRHFIVEMQMVWSQEFRQRVLFNASKAYVRQIEKGNDYSLLQPVYSLNLVNEVFEPELREFYHYYRLVHVEHTEKVIDGLHLVFVELPKFNPHTYSEKRMQVLWLRYLTEIDERTRKVPEELLENPELKKAVDALEESAFSDGQLAAYERFWDTISVEKTLYNSGMRKGIEKGIKKGIEKGIKEGIEKGRAEGREEGIAEGRLSVARNLKQMGLDAASIAEATGLDAEAVERL